MKWTNMPHSLKSRVCGGKLYGWSLYWHFIILSLSMPLWSRLSCALQIIQMSAADIKSDIRDLYITGAKQVSYPWCATSSLFFVSHDHLEFVTSRVNIFSWTWCWSRISTRTVAVGIFQWDDRWPRLFPLGSRLRWEHESSMGYLP